MQKRVRPTTKICKAISLETEGSVVMAKIIFSLQEAKEPLLSKVRMPLSVTDVKAEGDNVSFVLKTGLPLLSSIPISIRYIGFANSIVTFELTVNFAKAWLMKKAINSLIRKYAEGIPDYVRVDYPKVYVDVNALLLKNNLKGVKVDGIVYGDGEFTVVTCKI